MKMGDEGGKVYSEQLEFLVGKDKMKLKMKSEKPEKPEHQLLLNPA